jgi:integrase
MTERPIGSGTWRLRAYAGRNPISDTPIQVHRTFRGTETAARKALAKLVTEVEERKFDRNKATVGQLLDRWLVHVEQSGKARPKTVYEYERKIDGRIRPALGDVLLEKLEPDLLDAWYQRWLGEGLSPSTVRVYHSILSAACRQAVKWGWIDRAPTDRASAPTPRPPVMRVPTPEQLSTLVATAECNDPVLAAAVALAALTGARRGELVALRWSDVDLETGTIRIARAMTVVAGEQIEGPTKSHQVRQIALDEIGVELLRRHWRFVGNRSEQVESPLVDDPFVLSYQAHSGIPVSPDTVTHRFSRLCKVVEKAAAEEAKKARRKQTSGDLYGFHFHELRHFSVTTLLAAGVDVRTVSERHGHATATMTLNRYAHALPERDRYAAGILGRALST